LGGEVICLGIRFDSSIFNKQFLDLTDTKTKSFSFIVLTRKLGNTQYIWSCLNCSF